MTSDEVAMVRLGNTGLTVSRLCFGVLSMGPLQLNMPVADGSAVIDYALERGIRFLDTADLYGTYSYIRAALGSYAERHGWDYVYHNIAIASKSMALDYEEMDTHVQKAFHALGVPRLAIFLLHAPKSGAEVFEERKGALRCLKDYKKRGLIQTVGISTHNAHAVAAAAEQDDIDVVFPLINRAGMGLVDSTLAEMLDAIASAARAGKGIYAMKVFAGGNLLHQREEAISFVLNNPHIHAIAVGMVSTDEVEVNLRMFRGEAVPRDLWARTAKEKKRALVLKSMCRGCGTCIDHCAVGAMSLRDGKATVDKERCILCGYCGTACPEMAIRFV